MIKIKDIIKDLDNFNNLDFTIEDVDEAIKEDVIKKADAILPLNIEDLPLSLFKEFKRDGKRKNFENIYFKRRYRLGTLALAEALTKKGKYLDKIDEYLWAISGENAWVLSAHNSYIRDTEALDIPLLERPILDLFSLETAEIFSMVKMLLKDDLNPIMIKNIEYLISERIKKPYLNDYFWWMGGERLNNWSSWCTQNAILSLFSLPLEKEEKKEILLKAADTLDQYIADYDNDGCSTEGPVYYHASAITIYGSLYLLSIITGGKTDILYKEEKIKKIMHYIESVHVADDIYINYADSSAKAGELGAREYLAGKAVGDIELMNHAIRDYKEYGYEEKDNYYNLFYRYLALKYSKEILSKVADNIEKESYIAYENNGLYILREDDITIAIKAGDNNDSHNHNDIGSITMYKKTTPLLIDIGVETYTKKTFSSERYTLFPMRSTYHNTVNFPPYEEKDGKDYFARVISADRNTISMELKDAYDKKASISSYIRTLSFDRKGKIVTVKEDTKSKEEPELSLITEQKPKRGKNSLSFTSFSITFNKEIDAKVEEIDTSDPRLSVMWKNNVYRTLIKFKGDLTWTITTKEEKNEN